jgi:hypothetical protein
MAGVEEALYQRPPVVVEIHLQVRQKKDGQPKKRRVFGLDVTQPALLYAQISSKIPTAADELIVDKLDPSVGWLRLRSAGASRAAANHERGSRCVV